MRFAKPRQQEQMHLQVASSGALLFHSAEVSHTVCRTPNSHCSLCVKWSSCRYYCSLDCLENPPQCRVLVDALCKSVCKANIRSYESKTESTECKTFLGLAMFCLKIPRSDPVSQPSVLTQVCPVLNSKADLFLEV